MGGLNELVQGERIERNDSFLIDYNQPQSGKRSGTRRKLNHSHYIYPNVDHHVASFLLPNLCFYKTPLKSLIAFFAL